MTKSQSTDSTASPTTPGGIERDTSIGTSPKKFKFSSMRPGDACGYRATTTDRFTPVRLYEMPLSKRELLGRTSLSKHAGVQPLVRKAWVPRITHPAPKNKGLTSLDFLKTGGRTYLFPEGHSVQLDLKDNGWSDTSVKQEFRPELKGGGTLIDDSGITPQMLGEYFAKHPKVVLDHPALAITRKSDRGRPKGAQLASYGLYSIQVTDDLLQDPLVKFAPTVLLHELPQGAMARINELSKHLQGSEKRCENEHFAQEIRLTPSTVRAVYFDKASSVDALRELCLRVSDNPASLLNATRTMVADARRYLEVLSTTTKRYDYVYGWSRVGDIQLSWRKDGETTWNDEEVDYYKQGHPFAWYLAKDMTVAPTGFWFVDLESLVAGSMYMESPDEHDLFRKQELYALRSRPHEDPPSRLRAISCRSRIV